MRKTLAIFLVAFIVIGTGLVYATGESDGPIDDVEETILNLEGQVSHLIVDLRDAQGVEDGRYLVPPDSIRI